MANAHPSILVIDDDENYPKIMTEAFRFAKIPGNLTWKEDAETALSDLEKAPAELPDLVLLDINMPGMNGFEFLAKLRENKALHSLPVLMLSISRSPEDVKRSYQLGANAYITKPTDFKKMQEMLQSISQFWFQHVTLPRPN